MVTIFVKYKGFYFLNIAIINGFAGGIGHILPTSFHISAAEVIRIMVDIVINSKNLKIAIPAASCLRNQVPHTWEEVLPLPTYGVFRDFSRRFFVHYNMASFAC